MLPTKQYSKNNTMEKTDFFLQAEKMYAEATARGTLFTKLLLFTKMFQGSEWKPWYQMCWQKDNNNLAAANWIDLPKRTIYWVQLWRFDITSSCDQEGPCIDFT